MKKIIITVLCLLVSVIVFGECEIEKTENKKAFNLFKLPAYEKIDYSADLSILTEKQGWVGGCTVGGTIDKNSHTIVGRNMDLYISDYPVYYFLGKDPQFYKTINVVYAYKMGPDSFEYAKGKGLGEYENVLPFMCADVLNEKGFYIERNMRGEVFDENGNNPFYSSGTNPNAKDTVSLRFLPRYLGDRCADVKEALELVKNINIKSLDTKVLNWNFAFFMADTEGRMGVLEVGNNEIYFTPCQSHANFYIYDKFLNIADNMLGLGRYQRVMQGIYDVKSLDDMNRLMDKVYYSEYIKENPKFNTFPEATVYKDKSPLWIIAHQYDKELIDAMDDYNKKMNAIPRKELYYNKWETIYQTLTDCNKKQMIIIPNEKDRERIVVNFDNIEK